MADLAQMPGMADVTDFGHFSDFDHCHSGHFVHKAKMADLAQMPYLVDFTDFGHFSYFDHCHSGHFPI